MSYNIKKLREKMFPGRGGASRAAERLGVSSAVWSHYENTKRLQNSTLEKLAKFFKVKVTDLISTETGNTNESEAVANTLDRLEAPPKSRRMKARPNANALRLLDYDKEEGEPRHFRVVGEAAAFEGNGARVGGFGENDRSIWEDVEIPGETYFVRAIGDSMSPLILDGQYAMVGPEYLRGAAPKDGDIVVAEVKANEPEQAGSDAPWEGVYVKRVFNAESTWLFRSINPAYQDFPIHKNDCRMWPVIGVYFAGKGKPPKED